MQRKRVLDVVERIAKSVRREMEVRDADVEVIAMPARQREWRGNAKWIVNARNVKW